MKHIFIVNPVSGHGKSKQIIPWIHSYFQENPGQYEVLMTQSHGHATELTHQYSQADDVCVYACGGDGTVNEVLNGLQDGVTMALIPTGTGNDFTRMFEYPKWKLKQILYKTIEGKEVMVDYGLIDDRRFMNCATMGFDADINLKAEKLGKKLPIPSKLVYIASIFPSLKERKPMNLTLTIDETYTFTSLLTAVMNGRFYGGGFLPTPKATCQDGLFDICVVKNPPLSTILLLLPKYMKGTHTKHPMVVFFKGKKLRIQAERVMNVQIDGEVSQSSDIHLEIVHKGAKVRVPQASVLQ
jgi:diacylglycerol kinase (ATP)